MDLRDNAHCKKMIRERGYYLRLRAPSPQLELSNSSGVDKAHL